MRGVFKESYCNGAEGWMSGKYISHYLFLWLTESARFVYLQSS